MKKTTYRYVVNALGKGGEIYLTHCHDKYTLKKWLKDQEDDLILDEIKITDKKRHPFLKLFSFEKIK